MAAGEADHVERVVEGSVEAQGSPGDRRRATDRSLTRRDALSLVALSFTTILSLGFVRAHENAPRDTDRSSDDRPKADESDLDLGETMRVHYLEIVTNDVDGVCTLYTQLHGVTFGDADPSLGGARTAQLANGGRLGVRAPLNEGERLVVRPYMLVEDIEAAVAAAEESGARISLPPMEIPGHGICAIVFQGEIETGLWQL